MDFQEKLKELKEDLARESLDTYMTIEGEVRLDGDPEENLREYVNAIKDHHQKMVEHSNDMPNDIQNGGLVHMILSRDFMEKIDQIYDE